MAISGFIGKTLAGAGLYATSANSIAVALTGGLVAQGVSLGCPMADMEPIEDEHSGFTSRAFQSIGPTETMTPIKGKWHFGRWRYIRAMGTCMDPVLLAGQYIALDRHNVIRRGDLITFHTEKDSLIKRFVGVEGDYLIVETTNPQQTYRVPLSKVKWAYRVRIMAVSKKAAVRAAVAACFDETKHNELLGRIRSREGNNVLKDGMREAI